MTVIEQRLEDRLKLQGTTEDQIEYLEELKTQIIGYNPRCPPLEQVQENQHQANLNRRRKMVSKTNYERTTGELTI